MILAKDMDAGAGPTGAGRPRAGDWLARWLSWLRLGREVDRPDAAPDGLKPGLRLYAIGDIHGEAALLDRLMAKIDDDLAAHRPAEALAIFLGDYVDRGPDSAGVIDRLARGTFGLPHVALRGNHEDAMLAALAEGGDAMERWCRMGGVATLASYGVDLAKPGRRKALAKARDALLGRIPAAHRAFLGETRLIESVGDYVFVHAGLRPGIPIERQAAADLMWIREEFLRSDADFGKVVVHGHSPRPWPENQPRRINVDTGAFKSGVLTAVALEGAGRRFLSTGDPDDTRSD
jgi:serine/threonine protein phosphatase 1